MLKVDGLRLEGLTVSLAERPEALEASEAHASDLRCRTNFEDLTASNSIMTLHFAGDSHLALSKAVLCCRRAPQRLYRMVVFHSFRITRFDKSDEQPTRLTTK